MNGVTEQGKKTTRHENKDNKKQGIDTNHPNEKKTTPKTKENKPTKTKNQRQTKKQPELAKTNRKRKEDANRNEMKKHAK